MVRKSYVWLLHLPKIYQQALHVQNFLKAHTPSYSLHLGILFIFAALGFCVWFLSIALRIPIAHDFRIISPTSTKSGSVVVAVIHCVFLILILSKLNRIISIVVVKREQESFIGCRETARAWKGNKSLIILSISVENRYRYTETIW